MAIQGIVRPVGADTSELCIDHGPGYRVSLVQRGNVPIVRLCGGDEPAQGRDIKHAKAV